MNDAEKASWTGVVISIAGSESCLVEGREDESWAKKAGPTKSRAGVENGGGARSSTQHAFKSLSAISALWPVQFLADLVVSH